LAFPRLLLSCASSFACSRAESFFAFGSFFAVREFFALRVSLAAAFLSLAFAVDLEAVRLSFLASFVFADCFLTSALRAGAGFFVAEDFLDCAEMLPAVSARANISVKVNQARRFAGYINFMFYLSRSKDFERLFLEEVFRVPQG